ncbi:MAG: phage integrase family protein [Firmicutes bacterium]|nr:phage integrase family protein [Bacillota bacterium]
MIRVIENPKTWKDNQWRYQRNKAIVYLSLFAGLRVSEITNLQLDEIDFDRRLIYINNSKGGKSRIVQINKTLQMNLKEWIKIPLNKE